MSKHGKCYYVIDMAVVGLSVIRVGGSILYLGGIEV